jgi:gas vesicle protein
MFEQAPKSSTKCNSQARPTTQPVQNSISVSIKTVVELDEQTSNQLFDILQDWNSALQEFSDQLEP